MLRYWKLFGIALTAVTLSQTSTAEAARFSIAGNLNYGLSKFETEILGANSTTKGALGFGGGLLAEFGSSSTRFELGAMYMSRKSKTEASIGGTAIDLGESGKGTSSALHIPVMVRFGNTVSFGLGGYFDLSLESGGGTDYGLIAGPRVTLPMGLFFDGRFAYGLKTEDNPFNPSETLRNMEAQLLIGYTFGKGRR